MLNLLRIILIIIQVIFGNYLQTYMSCAEKYDFLVGDYTYTLTNAFKNVGASDIDSTGDVPEWIGYCHGWSPASYTYKRPTKVVTLTASDGKTQVPFLQEDIKALATIYWAQANYYTRIAGNLCDYGDNESAIPSDPSTGLWLDNTCFAINPASLVIIFENQVGITKGNIIFNPAQDGEIWNQPCTSYSMGYFNPLTNASSTSITSSRITLAQLKASTNPILQFVNKYRNPSSTNFIGVNMTINYVVEIFPVHDNYVAADAFDSASYSMILELDNNNNIIGGEWTTNTHPTFVWNISTAIPYTQDSAVPTFNGSVAALQALSSNAKSLSSQQMTVLKSIVDYLVAQSSS